MLVAELQKEEEEEYGFSAITEATLAKQTFEVVCIVIVGNSSLNSSVIQTITTTLPNSQPCVWSVSSYNQLPDIIPQIHQIFTGKMNSSHLILKI